MKVMILAAGLGTRMKPLTDHRPKPLLKVGDKSLLEWHIEKLSAQGFRDFVINIAWKGYKIPKVIGDGSRFGVNISYSDEQDCGALETAGGIKKALPLLVNKTLEPFLVVNGDIWCDYKANPHFELSKDTLAHCVLVNNPPHNPTGDFGFIDTPTNLNTTHLISHNAQEKYTFSGIAYYHPTFFGIKTDDYHEPKLLYTNDKIEAEPLAPLLKQHMKKQAITGELFEGEWQDIGTPERLETLNNKLKKL